MSIIMLIKPHNVHYNSQLSLFCDIFCNPLVGYFNGLKPDRNPNSGYYNGLPHMRGISCLPFARGILTAMRKIRSKLIIFTNSPCSEKNFDQNSLNGNYFYQKTA